MAGSVKRVDLPFDVNDLAFTSYNGRTYLLAATYDSGYVIDADRLVVTARISAPSLN